MDIAIARASETVEYPVEKDEGVSAEERLAEGLSWLEKEKLGDKSADVVASTDIIDAPKDTGPEKEKEKDDDIDSSPDSDDGEDEKSHPRSPSSSQVAVSPPRIEEGQSNLTLCIKKSGGELGSEFSSSSKVLSRSPSKKKKREDKERKSEDGSSKEKHREKHHKEKKKKKKKHKHKNKHKHKDHLPPE